MKYGNTRYNENLMTKKGTKKQRNIYKYTQISNINEKKNSFQSTHFDFSDKTAIISKSFCLEI